MPSGHGAKDTVVVSLKPEFFLPSRECRVVNTECQEDVIGCQDLGTPQLHLFRILELEFKTFTFRGTERFKTAVPKLSGTRDQFRGRQFFHGQVRGWFQNDSSTLRKESSAVNIDKTSLSGQLFTSCCMARWLTGCRLILVHGLAVGDP